jgi:hypothetical protein
VGWRDDDDDDDDDDDGALHSMRNHFTSFSPPELSDVVIDFQPLPTV